ncbi:FAD-binding oxidoreductase [Georgenia subflava]|uniref:FAD-binding protein n=1 Tax=Georgenia subflava TaxID=1622177 RepID=A0A6N7EHM9_9MICO|nr:FAD-binding oxidoreductase [Georgenia subflava]MPV36217.1 FAD-binding protein [Georgenia subflava]
MTSRISQQSTTTDLDGEIGPGPSLDGRLLRAGTPGFDAALRLWNSMIKDRPKVVAQPGTSAEVGRAIRIARENDLEVSIKGGGHSVAGYATTDGGMMVDLERLRGVQVDPARRLARVGGGARWADVDQAAGAFGLATTGGVVSTTGVGGLTLGGGVGWLVGKHGLASDNLRSVDLVTADGQELTASPDSHPDLFWALRGGGGNFGVATSFEFDLHPQQTVLAGMVAHPPARAREVLEFHRALTADAPDELIVYAGLMAEPEHGTRMAALAFCWSGDPAEADAAVRPILEFGPPVMTMAETMPYAAWNGGNDILFPYGRRYYWKAALMRELDDRVLEAVAEFGANAPLPWLNATIEYYGGAMNRQPAGSTAFPHRDAKYQVVVVGAWDDPREDETGIRWVRDLHAAVEPFGKQGDFLNFVAMDGADRSRRIREGYGESWDRLVEVKRRYDPDNVFHRNNTVTP